MTWQPCGIHCRKDTTVVRALALLAWWEEDVMSKSYEEISDAMEDGKDDIEDALGRVGT